MPNIPEIHVGWGLRRCVVPPCTAGEENVFTARKRIMSRGLAYDVKKEKETVL